jgi:Ca2+-binding EF-hand superfamily protein
VEDFAVAHFGFNLKEVQQYAANLKQTIDASRSDAQHKNGEYKASFGAGEKLGVKDNKYTVLTLDDLATAAASLEEAIAKMQAAYDSELARHTANDKLCQDFAHIANPLAKHLDDVKDGITSSKAGLEAQVQAVKDRVAAHDGDNEIKQLNEIQVKLDAAGVTDNPHSHFNAAEISTRVDQYHQFLSAKLKQLEEEVSLVALRGLTKEQLAEIAAQFKQFDGNGNGRLDKTEFKACLYSLNEERTKADIQKIMKDHGDGQGITYQGFTDFMIKLLGDTDTQDEVVAGFTLLAHGNDKIKEPEMSDLFGEFEIDYMKKTMKPEGPAYDFKPWVVDVFSR